MKPGLIEIDNNLANKILDIVEANLNTLSDFEKAVLQDRFEALSKYGNRACITPKQLGIIDQIYIKYRIDRIKNKTDMPR